MKKLLLLPVVAAFVVPYAAADDTANIPGLVYYGEFHIAESHMAYPVEDAVVTLYKRTAAGG